MMTVTRLEQRTAIGAKATDGDGDRTTDDCGDGSSRSWSSFQKPELF
jgi:hypothetical protein